VYAPWCGSLYPTPDASFTHNKKATCGVKRRWLQELEPI